MSKLDFLIKYGSDKQRDAIMDRHQSHLHIFKNQFDRTATPLTDDQYFRMYNAHEKFKRGEAKSAYKIAKETSDPELIHHFVNVPTIFGEDISKNPHLSHENIHSLIDSSNVYTHFNIAQHPNLSNDHIERLIKHTNPDVRDLLIDHHRNKMTPEQIQRASMPNYKDPHHDI